MKKTTTALFGTVHTKSNNDKTASFGTELAGLVTTVTRVSIDTIP